MRTVSTVLALLYTLSSLCGGQPPAQPAERTQPRRLSRGRKEPPPERPEPAWPPDALLDTAFGSLISKHAFSQSDYLLDSFHAARGTEHLGSHARLRCVLERLRSQQPVRVVALGGSISAGLSFGVRKGAVGAWLYHAKVANALNVAFPPSPLSNGTARRHAHYNGALPATGPGFFELCLESRLPDGPIDLILLEFAANTEGRPDAFERLLRRLLSRPNPPGHAPPAIVVVNTHIFRLKGQHRMACWKKSNANQATLIDSAVHRKEQTWEDKINFGDEDRIAEVAAHYDTPLVSVRSALLEEMKRGMSTSMRGSVFMNDCKHPNGQGHTYLAQMVLARLWAAKRGAGDNSSTCDGADAPTTLPPPMLPGAGAVVSSQHCATGPQMKSMLVAARTRGFVYTDEGRQKWGYVGNATDEVVTFHIPEVDAAVANATAARSKRRH